MRKRIFFIILIWVFAIVLGATVIYIRSRKEIELRNEYSIIDTGMEGDPIIEKLLQTNETSQSANTNEEEKIETSKDHALTSDQKKRAEQLTSLFENGTIEIKYSYVENLDDGRGITAGRAGFTTRDGDAYMVVKAYTKLSPNNVLAKYLDPLKKLAEKESDSTSGLSGYESAWKKATKDSKFRDSQDYVVDKLYFIPSQEYADGLDLKTPIARAFMYDTIIQHGDGDDKDSINSLIDSTNSKMGGSPKDGIDELKWFEKFMEVRKNHLKNAADESTRDVWAESIGRVDVYKQIFDSKNYNLKGSIKIKTKEYDVTIP